MDIKELRLRINEIDKEMASLFEKRMEVARLIAEYKKENAIPIFDKKREEELIKTNSELIQDPAIRSYYINFLKSVMEESKKYQSLIIKGMKVAYSGVPGAFAHIAAKKMYPDSEYIAYPDFQSAYKACENGEVDAVVLPVENSFAGDVGVVLDLIFQGSLYINQMLDLEIVQNLLAIKGSKVENIKKVYSHQQALFQCNDYIIKHGFERVECSNTAIAAQEVARLNNPQIAAIGSALTAELYGLEIISSHINTSNSNSTRFASFSRTARVPDKENKMGEHFVLVYTVHNRAGALAETLNIIGSHNFNMRNVRSRPMKELMWNYYFYVEIEGNVNSNDGEDVINELKGVCDRLKLVGTYYEFKEN